MLNPDPVSSTIHRRRVPLWLRALSRLPWRALYGLAAVAAAIAQQAMHARRSIVRANIAGSFPEVALPMRREIERRYYRSTCERFAEAVKAATLSAEELTQRVSLRELEIVQRLLDEGRPVTVACAHQCNWEWLLLALSVKLNYPLAVACEPLAAARAYRAVGALRARFGAELLPARELPMHTLTRRTPRVVAIIADREPETCDYQWWTTFLNRPTAFCMGPERIAQRAKYALVFAAMRRIERGRYDVEFTLLSDGTQPSAPGLLTERYARLVEAQVRASPSDWMWSHRRWKLRRPLYAAAADALDSSS